MKTIWKFKVLPPDFSIMLPTGFEILTIHEQRNEAYLWILVNPDSLKELVKFKVWPTGIDMPDNSGTYIGTFFINAGGLVFHLFIDKNVKTSRMLRPIE